ncbi:MAG: hypothetical protein P8R54_06740 [Myxococcota bacterium]|nr:hypothetical protein [Myxococcota bacterium]
MMEIPSDDPQRTRAVVVLDAVLVPPGLSIGWGPHDEGLLAGDAERVMSPAHFAGPCTCRLGSHAERERLAMMLF